MIFNSFTFVLFFLVFIIFYWKVFNRNLNHQNIFLLAGSYVFYGWSDYRFLLLLIVCSVVNYYLGIAIENSKNERKKKMFVALGILQGVGMLIYFKYFNFFILSFRELFEKIGFHTNLTSLNIIVPLGISFYTFRTISYILDIDKRKISASKNLIVFLNYVSFFPSILSGPIDKARGFIPQIEQERELKNAQISDALRQILWGLFKKLIIADYCSLITDDVFNNFQSLPPSTLWFGIFLYTVQVYADFSGYSDIAIGIASLMGFKVTKNFDYPYFAQNIADFWRRWHISLTSWFTEYVFTPLSIAFRDFGNLGLILAILINLTIVGIWHGGRWNNILYGFIHGCYFIPLILLGTMNKKSKFHKDRLLPTFREVLNMSGTFSLVMFTFILFRADTISDAYFFLLRMFESPFKMNNYIQTFNFLYWEIGIIFCLFIVLFFAVEWLGRLQNYGLACVESISYTSIRWTIYAFIIFLVFIFMRTNQTPFIYLKF